MSFKALLHTLFWFTYFCLYLLYSLPTLLRVNWLQKRGNWQQAEDITNRIAQKWAKSIISLTGSKVEVQGLENIPQGNVLFISNHQGNFDIPLLIAYINKPKGFIAKIELKKVPIINWWMKKINCVFIDRDNIRQSAKAIKAGTELLKAGNSMVLFPEGTRSRSSVLGEFKPGGMRLAIRSGVPIVPVTINGSYKIFEQNGCLIKPAEVKITVSPPIYVNKMSKEEQANLAEIVRAQITKQLVNK